MRSHPPTLLTLARRAIEDHDLVPAKGRVLAAVSGGPDSMALLHVLAILGKKMKFEVVAHGVDHGLRASAKKELDLAASFAREIGVEFSRTKVRVARGGNLQARAREARLAALERARVSAKADVIATAHHADDRAETVLLRILRGTGARGLGVLPFRAAHAPLVRPLLLARRDDIERHIGRHSVPFSIDPSNADPRFLRSRVRHELIPLMNELNAGVVDHLCRLAAELADPLLDPAADSEER